MTRARRSSRKQRSRVFSSPVFFLFPPPLFSRGCPRGSCVLSSAVFFIILIIPRGHRAATRRRARTSAAGPRRGNPPLPPPGTAGEGVVRERGSGPRAQRPGGPGRCSPRPGSGRRQPGGPGGPRILAPAAARRAPRRARPRPRRAPPEAEARHPAGGAEQDDLGAGRPGGGEGHLSPWMDQNSSINYGAAGHNIFSSGRRASGPAREPNYSDQG